MLDEVAIKLAPIKDVDVLHRIFDTILSRSPYTKNLLNTKFMFKTKSCKTYTFRSNLFY